MSKGTMVTCIGVSLTSQLQRPLKVVDNCCGYPSNNIYGDHKRVRCNNKQKEVAHAKRTAKNRLRRKAAKKHK